MTIDQIPADIAAETCVLGSMILGGHEAIGKARAIISADAFYRPVHWSIFNALCELADGDGAIDLVILRDKLERAGQLDKIGGVGYLTALAEGVPSHHNVQYYAQIVADKAARRTLLCAAADLQRKAADPGSDLGEVLAAGQASLADVASKDCKSLATHPAYLSAAALVHDYPRLREPVINGVLRRGEICNLVSAPKMHKSWLVLYIAICIAMGRQALGFGTSPGRVLILDYELAPGTLAKRLQAVLSAMGLSVDDLGDRLVFECLRGKRLDVHELGKYIAALERGQFGCIIIDPLYRIFPLNLDENDNAKMADVYAVLQSYAERLDAAMIVIHHLTKGSQYAKSVTDLGAGGGSQSRSADAHLAIRAHEEDGAAVLSGVVRSWPPFDSFCLRWEHPLWQLASDLDPADLKRPSRRSAKKEAEQVSLKPTWDTPKFAEDFLTAEPQLRAAIIMNATDAGVPNDNQAKGLLEKAEACGLAHRWKRPKDKRAYYANRPQPVLIEAEKGGELKT